MRRFLTTFGLLALAAPAAAAPSGQAGVGVSTGTYGIGGHAVYVVSPALQVGSQIGLGFVGDTAVIALAPYGKFHFGEVGPLAPFAFARLDVLRGSWSGYGSSGSDVAIDLAAGIGGEYYTKDDFGVFGALTVFDLDFDSGDIAFGMFAPTVGIEWFFGG